MDAIVFTSKSVASLQKYLKDRGVVFSGSKKADLVQLCEHAEALNIEVDPDGLVEDRSELITEKLRTENNNNVLTSPQLLQGSTDLASIPLFSIFDIYNYLISFDDFCHASMREYHKMEGYCMFKDGYVLNVETVTYESTDYVGIKAQVRPRTKDKDPISKKGYYSSWIIMKKSVDGCIQSAYCTCKGGMDGCCRHVVATLFEINDFMQDFEKSSCTSKACSWVRRASQADNLGKPVSAADLDTSVVSSSSIQCPRPLYFPLSDNSRKPDPGVFFDKLKALCPSACALRAKFACTDETMVNAPLNVSTPLEKLVKFIGEHKCCSDICKCVNIFIYYYLCYSDEECDEIETSTCGQSNNPNCHLMRKGLLTASVFHQICSSTNLMNTATALLKGGTLDENRLPAAIMFGRRYESKARNTFLRAHRFRHRQCTLHVPGLVMCKDTPFLACSPDGIVDCKTCGKFLIEIKCSYKYKCFHPTNALKLSKICEEDENKDMVLKRSHKYFDQVQGQMAITGVTKCVLVCYTHKGISSVDVEFDEDFWKSSLEKFFRFYREAYFPLLRKQGCIVIENKTCCFCKTCFNAH